MTMWRVKAGAECMYLFVSGGQRTAESRWAGLVPQGAVGAAAAQLSCAFVARCWSSKPSARTTDTPRLPPQPQIVEGMVGALYARGSAGAAGTTPPKPVDPADPDLVAYWNFDEGQG